MNKPEWKYLLASPLKRGKIIDKLEGYGNVIVEHIVKLQMVPESKWYDGWIDDIVRAVNGALKYK